MDLETIKKILEKEGGKVIIVEEGKPTLIISKFEEDIQSTVKRDNPSENTNPKVESSTEQSNNSIQLPEKTPQQETLLSEGVATEKETQETEEITLDDLPL